MNTTQTAPLRAVIYCRISRDDAGTGAAVARQEEACRGLALARGWDVVAVHQDTVSASKGLARPAWEQVLGMVDAGEVDVILAWHLDRITRSMLDLEQLITRTQDAGVGVATATGDIDLTTDTGRMVARILAAVARQEVERKSERQRAAERQRVTQGRQRWSRRPFGYDKDGTLRAGEAEHLHQAYLDIARGVRLSEVRNRWNNAGILTTGTGKAHPPGEWSVQSLRNLILNPRNKARIAHQGEEVGNGTWTPIVSAEEWGDAVAVLRSPARKRARAIPSDAWLVTVATCGGCGGRVFTEQRKNEQHRSYTCQRGCIHLPVEWVEGRVYLALSEALSDPVTVERLALQVEHQTEEIGALRGQHEALSAQLAGLGADYADGSIDRATMLAGTERLRERLAGIEGQLSEAGAGAGGGLQVDAEYLAEHLDAMPVSEVRETLRRVTDRIVLHRRGKGSREGLTPRLVEVAIKGSSEGAA